MMWLVFDLCFTWDKKITAKNVACLGFFYEIAASQGQARVY